MRSKFVIYILFALLITPALLMPQGASGQKKTMITKNPEGVEFWLAFQKNYKGPGSRGGGNKLQLEFFITGDQDANVEISIKGIGYSEKVFVPGGSVRNVKIPEEAEIKSSEIIEQLAIHLVSDNPVSVYGLNRRFQTTDTYLGLPVRVLGQEYRVISYSISVGYTPQFAIVATEDSTTVEITPTVKTKKHEANRPFTVILNEGDAYQVVSENIHFSSCDLTGSYIKADKKIAVFSGHQCAYVPQKIIACNHLVEQLMPLSAWGKHYYLGKLRPRSNYTYRVLANEPETRVFEDTTLVQILQPGEFFENTLSRNAQITASKPVLVAQYSQGYRNGDSIGDPMMILCSPTQQFLKKYRFATPVNGFWKHYINIVAPTRAIGTLLLDGSPVDSTQFQQMGLSRYSIAHVNVPYGSHTLTGGEPFGIYSYGFGYDTDAYDAYGTMGGQSFVEYKEILDTVPPYADIDDTRYTQGSSRLPIIIRDDRNEDTGLKNISVSSAENLEALIPEFFEGVPQIAVMIRALEPSQKGRLLFEAVDIAGNTGEYTICYVYDEELARFVYKLSQGDVPECEIKPSWQVGPFLKFSNVYHLADFQGTGLVNSVGKFKNAFGTGGYGGIYAGKKFKPGLALSARLSFENYGGDLEAPGPIDSVRGENGALIPFEESVIIDMNALFMHLAITAEKYFDNNIYLLGGLNAAFTLSSSVDVKKRIIRPGNLTYSPGGGREKPYEGVSGSTESFNFFRIGIFGGIGFNYAISPEINLFLESALTYHLSSVIDDGDWNVLQHSFLFGAKYRL